MDDDQTRRVLITGIAGTLASRLAALLEQHDEITEIIGVDTAEPAEPLTRTEFVRADLRNPLVGRVVEASRVDTVVHLATEARPGIAGGRARQKEQNVIGAMQLFAACQKAQEVRRVVVKSSTNVYGSDHTDPALFRETQATHGDQASGFTKDVAEIESYARSFGRRRKDVQLTILRFANFLGGDMDSVLSSFFTLPVVPSVLGFDPRLQFVHQEDGLGVLERAVRHPAAGIYNVAGPGVLYLSQCVRRAGRLAAPLPMPLVSAVATTLRRTRRVDFSPEQLRFLQFGRAVDVTRLVEDFGYTPRYTTEQTFDDFLARRRIRSFVNRDDVVRLERELYDFLQRKGQERFLATRTTPGGGG